MFFLMLYIGDNHLETSNERALFMLLWVLIVHGVPIAYGFY